MDAHEPVRGVVVRGEGADDRLRVVEEQQRVVRRDPTLHLRDHARRHPNVRVEPVISLEDRNLENKIYGSSYFESNSFTF